MKPYTLLSFLFLFGMEAVAQQYCTPVYEKSGQACIQGYGRIANVHLSSAAGELADTPVCGSDYRNRTTKAPLKVAAGGQITGTLLIKYTSTHTNVWIDFDDNGTFDAKELLFITGFPNYEYSSPFLGTAPWYEQVYKVSFNLPAGSRLGIHRMRIRTAYLNTSDTNITLDPCARSVGRHVLYYGTTLDYSVEVLAPGHGTCRIAGY
jgi:hypothetical protein